MKQVVDYERVGEWARSIIPGCIAILIALMPRGDQPMPAVMAKNEPPAMTETATAKPTQANSRTSTTPTPRPTPRIADLDRLYLARLCVVEVRDMSDVRVDACLSVISTVMARIREDVMSDGTIGGTIGWNCTRTSDWCQFPAYVLAEGCEGLLATACPHNYQSDIDYFRAVVDSYVDRGQRGTCDGYLYYWLRAAEDCRLESRNGLFTNFVKKAEQ